uniref:Dynein, cytoplasmic 1, intermediate chain 1 n=1 Tax=Sinocyclocheilus grahami TaxID=75366 RepID=A0A672QVY8_SINGR
MSLQPAFASNPLQLLTWETCYFHYLVPTPMSPSSQSVSPPSETGSQESIDGGTVGRLGPSKIVQIDFMPKELVTYSKESQTPVTSDQPEEEEEEELSVTKSESVPQQELTNEEKEQIIHSEDFQFFFDRSIRVMERVLAEDTDIFFDYSGRDMEDKEGSAKAYVTNAKVCFVIRDTCVCVHCCVCVHFGWSTNSEYGSPYLAGIGEMFDGHQGPVTGISCHNAVGPVDFSHLFTTSSFDWTVKLWSTKHNKPLYSFEDNADYVYDVMWSPVHPALFATVDGNGRLDLWNLNNYTEVPSASVTVEGGCALNQVRWASGGREVAVGDSEGHVWIYDVREQLAVPHTDDWSKFARTLLEIRANRGDGEEEGALELPA